MRVSQNEKVFPPVTIVLESPGEVIMLRRYLEEAKNWDSYEDESGLEGFGKFACALYSELESVNTWDF